MSYKTIQLPVEFVENYVDPYVSKKDGYTSRAEVIKAAVREFVAKMKFSKSDEKSAEVQT